MLNNLVSIPGYRISEEIYNGSRTLVYRAVRESDSVPVVIKLLKNPYPSFSELLLFRNQYTIGKNLNSPLVIQTYSLELLHNGYMLVMEDFGGISLNDYFAKNQNVTSLKEFLVIAIALCDILDLLYHERIIHKDIKPSNILINPATKQVKLIDFSIASLLPRETQTLVNPNVLEGTLAYLSPEQTGRMNRGIDYRTDFYSLGVTFYELLTDELPFSSTDAMELVHSHIAKIPPPIQEINPDIPFVISEIVRKLMAKNAEDRYQSALGLKFDLEKCLNQLKTTGEIRDFKIAQRDVCDRFIIPDKLYGRETEVQTLLAAFERVSLGATEMMLVAGFSGIGKTAVVNEVHKPIVRQRGYFIKGKYDQFQRNIPFSAFVQAFRDLMGQLLTESDVQIERWRNKILEAVGEHGQVIIEVIPELENIIGKQPPASELSGTAAQNRFNLLFQKFTQVFTTKEHPLVIFLDDLQWADSASLKLMQLLMADTGHLFIIGAYRDNETALASSRETRPTQCLVNPGHPLLLTLSEIQKSQAKINTITLAPLSQVQVNQLVADTLKCSQDLASSLTELVYQKTQGNPFFATQLLKAWHQDKLITFDFKLTCWQCDIIQIKIQAATDDVVAFMSLQLQKLPLLTQEVLQLAACIGNSFDLGTLAIVSQKSEIEIAAALWQALQEGLILPISEVYKFYQSENADQFVLQPENNNTKIAKYQFLHDRIQQAAYALIPDAQKTATHLRIGQLLLQNSSETVKQEKLFDIVEHLNLGKDLISQPSDRQNLAQLNLQAGVKAKNSTAYPAARTYLQTGITLLDSNCWQNQYELTLNLYITSTEVSYLNGDFEGMEQQAALVLQQAQTVLDRVKIYEIQIAAHTLQSHVLEAIAVGRTALSLLGVELPKAANETEIATALQTLNNQLENIPVETLVDLPISNDSFTQAAMRIMGILFPPMIQGMPSLLPLLSSKMVSLSLQSGNTVSSTIGYAIHGLVMSAFLADAATGYEFGKVALNLLEKFNTPEIKPIVMFLFGSFIQLHKEPLHNSIPTLKTAFDAGMETGNFMYAGFSLAIHSNSRFFSGGELSDFVQDMAHYSLALAQVKQYAAQAYIDLGKQTAENFIEIVSQPHCLTGNSYNEIAMLPKHQQDGDGTAIAEVYIYKLLLAYYFGDYQDAINYVAQAQPYIVALSGTFFVPIFYFYAALTHLQCLPSQSQQEQSETLTIAQTHQTNLAEFAHQAPMNHQHKVDLIEAQKQQVWGENYAAADLYDRAIAGAKTNGYIQEEALANELAAKFYLAWGKEKVAAGYMQEAYYCYSRWGAKAKIADLERHYPQLLAPILQQSRSVVSTNETIFTVGTVTKISSSASSSSVSHTLDLTAILKASQSISGEIELEKLLSSLLSIVIENAGADKCVLMLLQDNHLLIQGAITQGTQPIVLQSIAIADSDDIPQTLIYKVKNNQQTVVLLDANADITFAHDPYMIRQQPQSVLCSPILHQGKLLGILYLENNLAKGAFKGDRIELLNLLCTQAAISLENARLYQLSQESAQQLQRSLDELSASNSRFHNLVDNLPGVVYQVHLSTSGEQSLPYISAGCYKLWEIPAQQMNANVQNLLAIVHPEDIATFQQALGSAMTTLTSGQWSGRILTPSGIVKWVHAEGYIRKLVDGSFVWDCIMLDISERKQAELALQQAQLQIIQSEKMSALGNLVAGIAHEMNNPLGFIAASLKQAKPTFADICEHLKLYQDSFPNKTEEILDHESEIDLEYTIEDLPKMLDSMTMACDRLKNISTSLRTFSRADRDYKVPFNIHEGIDSTILILKHRLKANEQRPAIEVITDYGNLPQVKCFPGQLNQVFMNILANAIDALDESNQGRSFEEIQAHPNQITITTSMADKYAKISIVDNGKGMSEEVKQKIFDHLFTTKAVGKGTGLGLAIAKQIIEESHGGQLSCHSTLGQGTEFLIQLPL
ncbi:histidine kinase [Nostoc sp. CENA543]|uniref:ATP-binding sensor histidine kinase n=1 Tax=Nostoc sp. CENA543 TaxID=1869241 RepID=UPI000CA2F6C5|nr:ATP-binding sensor histidine kinase [Nostoc sp. CENA543]AUS99517.1 histidine kinase [Nostoc sp. CENA543]